jgi:hypothetical protein
VRRAAAAAHAGDAPLRTHSISVARTFYVLVLRILEWKRKKREIQHGKREETDAYVVLVVSEGIRASGFRNV